MNIYSARDNPPSPEQRAFPMELRHKKSASIMIYEGRNRGSAIYTVAFQRDGKRQRQMRRDFDAAFTIAKEIVLKMADGAHNVLTLDGRNRLIYERANELAGFAGVDLDVLVSRAVEASKIAGGLEHLPEAARLYAEQHHGVVQKTVSEVVTELIEDRRGKGRSELYLRDLRVRLERRVAIAFKMRIASIKTSDIETFLSSVKGSPRTKKNFLTMIGTLLEFAKKKGYMPGNHPGISKVEFHSVVTGEIQIFTPEQMELLLKAAKPEVLPALALGAFAGLRSEEIKRLDWSCIHLTEKFVEVPAQIAKTKSRRVVPMSENLRRWLLPYQEKSGRVFPYANLALQFGKLAKSTGVAWKKNALRHSFISYRIGRIDNVDKVALEAGNSRTVIHSNYLKMVTKAKARQWFSIMPSDAARDGLTDKSTAAPSPGRRCKHFAGAFVHVQAAETTCTI